MPKHIALVTSPTGAALRDILNVLERRYKNTQITLIPALVQGKGAAKSIVQALKMAEKFNIESPIDVMIVGRGGGSIEDLWCFNDEEVARAIFHSSIPIVSAVGHEIDFTISDFVADLRAPTPSAAAELVVRDSKELLANLRQKYKLLFRAMVQKVQAHRQRLVHLDRLIVDPKKKLQDHSIRFG